jgi:hypothetical protein
MMPNLPRLLRICSASLPLAAVSLVIFGAVNYLTPAIAQTGTPKNAGALYYRVDIPKDYSLSADIQLLPTPRNKDFAASWLLLLPRSNSYTVQNTPFVQVGIIRDARRKFELQEFVATNVPGGVIQYVEGKRIAEGWHRLEIRRQDNIIRLFVDDVQLFSSPESAFFSSAEALYMQIGAELRRPGDSIDSYWRNFTENRNGKLASFFPDGCFFDDRGLSFVTAYGIVRAFGTYDVQGPRRFRGSC